VGTQKEWLRRAGVIQFSRLSVPAGQVSADLYLDVAALLEEAPDHDA
jgi:hypothetical protein